MGNIKIVRGVFDTRLELEHAGVAAGFPSPADDYRHETLDFNRDYIRHPEASLYGDIFTNSTEGFWSHFRRMIIGCYHDVSDEHLQPYIDEAVYRWNTRKMSESERFAHMFNKSIGLVVSGLRLELDLRSLNNSNTYLFFSVFIYLFVQN